MVQRAEALLLARPHGPAPLLSMSADFGRILQLGAQHMDVGLDPDAHMIAATSKRLGRMMLTLDVTDHGIVSWGTLQLH